LYLNVARVVEAIQNALTTTIVNRSVTHATKISAWAAELSGLREGRRVEAVGSRMLLTAPSLEVS